MLAAALRRDALDRSRHGGAAASGHSAALNEMLKPDTDQIPDVRLDGVSLSPALIGFGSELRAAAFSEIVWNRLLADAARSRGLDGDPRFKAT